MITGTAFDETVNYHYLQKKQTGADEPVDVLQDKVREEFDLVKSECTWIPGQDTTTQQNKVLTACTKGIKEFRSKVLEKVEPEGVQIELLHEFTPGLKFKGYIDLLENRKGELILVDNKTTWRKWSGTEKLWQLISYAHILNEQGVKIKETRYDVCLLKKRDDPIVTRFTDFVNARQLNFVKNKLDWAVKYLTLAVKDTSMFNYNFNTWQCGNGCPYVDSCELELGTKLRS